jgi:4-amino-4-deoxy-L-arabinose transferase-like glycosyltransferase
MLQRPWETGSVVQSANGRLWAISFLAIVTKLVLLYGAFPYFQGQFPGVYSSGGFADGYDLIAWNLVQGNGYRLYPDTSLTMLRTPGFVLLLSVIFALFGKSLVAVQVVNVAFSSITAVLTHVLARKTGLSQTAGVIAALVFFFHPGILVAESRGGVECMLTLCLAASVLYALIAIERQNFGAFAIAGMLNGLAMLVKSSVAPILPALFLYSMWKMGDGFRRRKILAGMAICGFVTVLVMAPWVVRNYRLSGEFIPTMTVSGLVAFQGMYVIQHLDSHLEHFEILNRASDEQTAIANAMGLKSKGVFFLQFFRVEDEVSFYRELGNRALDNYIRDPKLILQGMAHNAWAFWAAGRTHSATMFNVILAVPLLVLSGIGLGAGLKRGLGVFPFFLTIVTFMGPHLFLIAVARLSLPLVPFMAIFAAIPLTDWFERVVLGEIRLWNFQARYR